MFCLPSMAKGNMNIQHMRKELSAVYTCFGGKLLPSLRRALDLNPVVSGHFLAAESCLKVSYLGIPYPKQIMKSCLRCQRSSYGLSSLTHIATPVSRMELSASMTPNSNHCPDLCCPSLSFSGFLGFQGYV